MVEKTKVTPKATMADLEARGVDLDALAPGAEWTVESVYPRRYKAKDGQPADSGNVGIGGKFRSPDGRLWQVTTAVLIR